MDDQNIGEFLGLDFASGAGSSAASGADFFVSLLQNGLIILFGIIIVAAIVYSAWAGLKYIRSQGASDKIEEANEAIKYSIIGLIVAFVGVIFVVIIGGALADGTAMRFSLRCIFGELAACEVRVVGSGDSCPDGYKACLQNSNGSTVCGPDGDTCIQQ